MPDPRSPRGLRHPLAGLLAVAVCAVMAGASSVTVIADWLHDLDDISRTGIVLAQVTVGAKSNEIPAFSPLLDAIETLPGSLHGQLFVADALHTQTGHANEIAARGAHPLIPVKGNQPTLHTLLKILPWAQIPIGHQTRERGPGRTETRTVKAVTVTTPGGIGFPTPSKPSGSPGPAPPPAAAKPPAKTRT